MLSFLSPVGPYVGRYCGQNTPGRIISYTGILALTINTDSAIAKEGFSANFTVIERTVPEGEEVERFIQRKKTSCGGIFLKVGSRCFQQLLLGQIPTR